MIWSRRHRPVHWTEIVCLGVTLFIVLLFMRGCDPAHAEWVTISEFKGLNTDISSSKLQMGEARYAVGVYIRDGELFNGDYMRHTGISYVSTQPCQVLGRLSFNNGILFDNGFLQWYDAAGDSSYIMQDTVVVGSDTARSISFTATGDTANDLIVFPALDTLMAQYAMSNLAGLEMTPVGGALKFVRIQAVYSEKYLRLRDTGAVIPNTKYFIKTVGNLIGNTNVSSLSFSDTTLFFNGTQMTVMTNNSVGLGSPYVTSLPPDTIYVRHGTASLVDTNLCGLLRFKGTAGLFRRADVGKYLYPQDTSAVYRGARCMIVRFDTTATAVYLCISGADTALVKRLMSRYSAAPIRVQIFSKPTMTLVADNIKPSVQSGGPTDPDSSVIYNPGCSTTCKMSVTNNDDLADLFDGRITTNIRALDNVWCEIREKTGWFGSEPRSGQITVLRYTGSANYPQRIRIVLDTILSGSAGCMPYGWGWEYPTYRAKLYRGEKFPIRSNDTSGVTVKTSHWTIAENHRGRAFYSGNKLKTPWDSTVTYRWSALDHYDSLVGLERLEGDAEIVGLSSMGSNLLFYRRRPPNAILSLSGFSDADFYLTPLTSGVGAVSDQSIARNPLDEADYFPNNLGMWKCDGGSVSKVETNCESIFQDSINWAAETKIVGAIFDNHYWLAAPFGTSTVNDRFLSIDLQSGAVTFVPNYSTWYPGSLKVLRLPGFQDRMFAGVSDTGQMFEIMPPGTYAELGTYEDTWKLIGNAGEWKSGWMDFGDPSTRKRITQYQITWQGDLWYSGAPSPDSVIVSFYKDFSATAAWTDRIGYVGTDAVTRTMPVAGIVQGHHISFGIQFKGSLAGLAGDAVVSRFAMDVVPVGSVKPR
jgi:hypothetical protein